MSLNMVKKPRTSDFKKKFHKKILINKSYTHSKSYKNLFGHF